MQHDAAALRVGGTGQGELGLLFERGRRGRVFGRRFLTGRRRFLRDGAAALDLLSRPGESRFDLVVSDQIMPQLSGVQLLRALRESGNRVPVVLYTGYADAVDESDARRLGAAALLYKPVDLDTLLAAAHAAMPTSSAAA